MLDIGARVRELTPALAGEAWVRLHRARAVLRKVEDALFAYARETPLLLPDGREVREVLEVKEYVLDDWTWKDQFLASNSCYTRTTEGEVE